MMVRVQGSLSAGMEHIYVCMHASHVIVCICAMCQLASGGNKNACKCPDVCLFVDEGFNTEPITQLALL